MPATMKYNEYFSKHARKKPGNNGVTKTPERSLIVTNWVETKKG